MDNFISGLSGMVSSINSLIWSPALVFLCLSAGIYFSFRTRFLQIRLIKEMVRLLFAGDASDKGISSFQALAVSVSGRVGTGNIAGVATAIAWGGPGALFWMWVIAFLGAGSAFVESTLAQIYKEEIDGEYRGGPAYYISKIFAPKGGAIATFFRGYGMLFAIVTVIAMGMLLPGVQSNSIAAAVNTVSPEGVNSSLIVAVVLAGLLGILIFGGVKRIGKFAEVVVPVMAGAYILVALIIVLINFRQIPEVFADIISSAFGMNSALGGILGTTIMWGVKRGIYSNEAGQGTGPQAAAAAEVSHPTKQGLVQAFSVYIDTLFVCTATGFMILMTNSYNVFDESTCKIIDGVKQCDVLINNMPDTGLSQIGPAYTQMAVDSVFSGFGSVFVAISIFMFAFTTLIAYYYIAETNMSYIIKKLKLPANLMINILRVVLIAVVMFGAMNEAGLAWDLGDIGVGLMAWLNVIAILIMAKPALECLKDYEKQMKMGVDPQYDPKEFGITNAVFWDDRNSK